MVEQLVNIRVILVDLNLMGFEQGKDVAEAKRIPEGDLNRLSEEQHASSEFQTKDATPHLNLPADG